MNVEPFTAAPEALLPLLEELPEDIGKISAAACEPLEIAAALEARGVSSRVAKDRFGEVDVFALARRLFDGVPPASASGVRPRRRRFGGPAELMRGAMFAAPGVMFAGAIAALHANLPPWTYLLSLTTGWAFGQAIAAVGSALAGRGARLGALALWWMLLAGAVTAALALLGDHWRDGGSKSVAMAAIVTLYVVSCSVLLLQHRVWSMALPLLPATALAGGLLLHRLAVVPHDVTVTVVGAAVAVTIAAALKGVPVRFWRLPALQAKDLGLAARYFCHGLLCGLATALIIILSSGSSGRTSVVPVAAYPVLLTLGVMEWQVYSFRARVERAMGQSASTATFARRASRSFLISLLIYVAVLAVVCTALGAYLVWRHQAVPTNLLEAEICLGCTFFVGLLASSCARIGAVLCAGVVGLATYAALYVHTRDIGAVFDHRTAQFACLVAVAAALAVALVGTQRTLRSAFSYQ